MSKSQIAREQDIARSTVYEELKRGTVGQMDGGYRQYMRYFVSL